MDIKMIVMEPLSTKNDQNFGCYKALLLEQQVKEDTIDALEA
jgi:hypothetical protein